MAARVMVFAPAPQLTITIESAPAHAEVHLHAGGQGFWQARMIHALGVDVTLCCALGGETGRVLHTLISAAGIDLAAVDVSAANGAYVHDRRSGRRVVVASSPGHTLSRHDQDDLYGTAIGHGLAADLCLLGGVAEAHILPPTIYRRLTGDLRRNNAPVMADLCGPYLTAAMESGLDLVKIADDELVADGRATSTTPKDLLAAMRAMRSEGALTVIVTRADQPALMLEDDGEPTEIVVPRLEPVDPTGAGDSMTAAVAAVIATGGDLATALQTGAAAGALNVARHGLGSGNADAIARLARLVRLNRQNQDEETVVIADRHMSIADLAGEPTNEHR
jgi:1-phosphofructokinase